MTGLLIDLRYTACIFTLAEKRKGTVMFQKRNQSIMFQAMIMTTAIHSIQN